MNKIFGYELKRLLWNKFYLILFVITIVYGYIILSKTIIRGVANTAPFSPWSFGYYLTQITPILLIALMFFVTFLFSSKEKEIQTITKATAVNQARYTLIRIGAMGIGFFIISLGVILTAVIFNIKVFHFTGIGTYVLPAVFVLIPSAIFILGLSLAAGRINNGLIYVIMGLFLLYNFISLPYTIDFIGSGFYSKFPKGLEDLDPTFRISFSYLIGRVIYISIGITLVTFHVNMIRRKP